jgi:hypothetical protein
MHRLSLVYHALSPTASGQDAVLGGLAERCISLAAPFFFSHFSAQRAHFNPVHSRLNMTALGLVGLVFLSEIFTSP